MLPLSIPHHLLSDGAIVGGIRIVPTLQMRKLLFSITHNTGKSRIQTGISFQGPPQRWPGPASLDHFLGRKLGEVLCPPCLFLGLSLVLMVEPQEESLGLGIIGSRVAEALAGSVLPSPNHDPRALVLQWLCLLLHHPEGACTPTCLSGFDLSKPLSLSETIQMRI